MQVKPKYITDEKILEWILSGELIIKYANRKRPILVFRGRTHTASIVEGHRNPRYRWRLQDGIIKLRNGRERARRRTIICSKLVWMFKHKRTVSEGCLIHHRDNDRFNDGWGNLEEMSYDHHEQLHNGSRASRRYLCRMQISRQDEASAHLRGTT